jgi:hypothetical protein
MVSGFAADAALPLYRLFLDLDQANSSDKPQGQVTGK